MKTASTLTKLLLASAAATVSFGASADDHMSGHDLSGYATNSSGKVVTGINGACWKTQFFTPAQAIEQCDPDLVPKAPPPAPKPVVKPKPKPRVIAPPPAPKPRVVTTRINLEADTFFAFNKAALSPEGRAAIDVEIRKLSTVDVQSVIAIGHTDSTGPEAYNQKLSVRRAQAVKDYMVSKGVPASRIEVRGMGESQPVASNKTRAGRSKNRRVEVEIRALQSR